MDALSDVLKSVRFEGAVYVNSEFTGSWCVWSSFGLINVSDRLASGDDILFFHFITEGRCKLQVPSIGETIEASAGDLILFSRDERHLIGSDLRLAPVEAASLALPGAGVDGDFIQLRHGAHGPATRVICGFFAFNRIGCRPLLDALPGVVRLSVGAELATALRDLLRIAVLESLTRSPGAESTLAKMAELIFVESLRRYVAMLPAGKKGWLAGVRDAKVGRALALIHGQPGRAWTIDDLCKEVAMSRSALSKRFAALVGEPPIQYLTRWRLAIAAQMLRSTDEGVSRIAGRNGYDSEESFSRAFKREFGLPPAAWRRHAGYRSPASGPHQPRLA